MRECHITLDLLDQDTVTGADQIYAPKVLSLEPLVAATYFARAWIYKDRYGVVGRICSLEKIGFLKNGELGS